MVVLLFDEGLRRAVVAVGVEEIYHHLFLPLAGEGVAVQSHALGGSQFDVDAVIVQMQPVVGRGGRFALVRVARGVAAVGILL